MSAQPILVVPPGVNFEDVWTPVQQMVQRAAEVFYGATRKRIIVTSGWRSPDYQAQLYATKDTNVNKYGEKNPVNKPGDSSHNFGLGVDTDIEGYATPAERKLWTTARRTFNLVVPANDWNHCEAQNWRKIAQQFIELQNRMNAMRAKDSGGNIRL